MSRVSIQCDLVITYQCTCTLCNVQMCLYCTKYLCMNNICQKHSFIYSFISVVSNYKFYASIISGCDRGFGETLACKLALEGYEVFAGCLDLGSDGAKRLRNYSNVTVLHLDVTDDKSMESCVQILYQRLSQKGEL